MSWDGNERRKQLEHNDHDLLIEIRTKIDNFTAEVQSLKSRVAWHDKFIYIGIGGVVVIEFVLKMFK